MADDKLKFMDMLSMLTVVDDNDRNRKFKDCIESAFEEISQKVSQYKKDGTLTITLKFKCDSKSNNAVDIYADVSKKIPKGMQRNQFYRDTRTGGLYLENPDQLKMFDSSQVSPIYPTESDTQSN